MASHISTLPHNSNNNNNDRSTPAFVIMPECDIVCVCYPYLFCIFFFNFFFFPLVKRAGEDIGFFSTHKYTDTLLACCTRISLTYAFYQFKHTRTLFLSLSPVIFLFSKFNVISFVLLCCCSSEHVRTCLALRQMLMKRTHTHTHNSNNSNTYIHTYKICRIHIGMLRGIEPFFGGLKKKKFNSLWNSRNKRTKRMKKNKHQQQ